MAKKSTANTASGGGGFNFSKLAGLMENMSKKSIVRIENLREERGYISTGIYILNALLSKSILKGGIPSNRITVIAGPAQTGKSYIAMSLARNAQKQGYNVLYIDTEFSIELSDFDLFGVDTSDSDKFMLIRENKVEKIKIFMAQFIDELKKLKEKGEDVSKTLIILDSVGQLASEKEIEDAIEGKQKADMSRAKAIRSLMRIITSDLGSLGIPLLATNHTYQTMDLFPQTVQTGGEGLNYSPSIIVYLSIAKLEDMEKDEFSLGSSGIVVTARSRKNRLARPKKVKFELSHESGVNPYKGLDFFCTPENFEKVGIAKVKPVVDKKTGEITYESGSKWYVKHLDKTLYDKQLYNGQVFSREVLEALEPIIYDYFRYPSYDEAMKEIEMIESKYDELESNNDFDIDSEEFDQKLFS